MVKSQSNREKKVGACLAKELPLVVFLINTLLLPLLHQMIDHNFVEIACSRKLLRASKNENLVIKAQENSSIDFGNSIARNIYTEY